MSNYPDSIATFPGGVVALDPTTGMALGQAIALSSAHGVLINTGAAMKSIRAARQLPTEPSVNLR